MIEAPEPALRADGQLIEGEMAGGLVDAAREQFKRLDLGAFGGDES